MDQTTFFKGIYEFEDPSGSLIAAKIPTNGTADLYSGTRILVKPNQCALFIYNGKIADILPSGNHEVKTENLPILTRLSNWKFGFESPLRCEIVFISGHIFAARKWGTAEPAIVNFGQQGNIPIRGFGNYNLWVMDPAKFFSSMVGTRSVFDVTELDEFVQGQILEAFPTALQVVTDIKDLNTSQEKVSGKLEATLKENLKNYGIAVGQIKTLSLLPPDEILKAMDERAAMQVIGNQKQYMLYKMANSFDAVKQGAGQNDPLHMMVGLMMGKSMMGFDDSDAHAAQTAMPAPKIICSKCGNKNESSCNFCSNCGGPLSK
jgi:membrane protease subunit (stomatin/prohibitin family)